MKLNFMKRKMTLSQREDWNLIIWCSIMIHCVILWYLYHIQNQILLIVGVAILLVLIRLMMTNNKEGLKLQKQKKKEKTE